MIRLYLNGQTDLCLNFTKEIIKMKDKIVSISSINTDYYACVEIVPF